MEKKMTLGKQPQKSRKIEKKPYKKPSLKKHEQLHKIGLGY